MNSGFGPLPSLGLVVRFAQRRLPIHKAQLLSYMKLLDVPLDLLINFHEMIATDGISRLILPGANL